MNHLGRRPPRWFWSITVSLACCLVASTALWAAEHALRARVFNPPHAPVLLKEPRATLVEEFLAPGQAWSPGVRGHRVANANHPRVSVFVIEGDVTCDNRSPQAVEAVGLMVVSLDAFHERTQSLLESAVYTSQHTDLSLSRRGSRRLRWRQPASSKDIYELAIVVRGVRFTDGSVWRASDEELVDIF